MHDDEQLQRQARALGDRSRHAIFRLIAGSEVPVDIASLTAAMHLHHNAVRQHIAKLRDAGLVEEWVDVPHGRGRPRLLYRVAPALEGRWAAPDAYVGLAGLLAEAVRTGDTPRQVGRRAGRRAADRHQGAADGVELIRTEAARLGFDPQVRRGTDEIEIVLRHCPFSEVAAADPAVVCDLHLGLAEGLADGVGDVTVNGIDVADPHHAGCRLVLDDATPVRHPGRARSVSSPRGTER